MMRLIFWTIPVLLFSQETEIIKKTLILLANLQFLVIFAQYEHTTYDYVLDIFLFCVRDSYVCVREKLYLMKL